MTQETRTAPRTFNPITVGKRYTQSVGIVGVVDDGDAALAVQQTEAYLRSIRAGTARRDQAPCVFTRPDEVEGEPIAVVYALVTYPESRDLEDFLSRELVR
jgi:hypothetical protein